MEEWREAAAVWLHEHGLMIAADWGSASTDYGLGAEEPEYTLSPELLKLVFDVAGLAYSKNVDPFRYGWAQSYKPYPTDCELVAVFVRPLSGGIEIKMHVNEKAGTAAWTEVLAYHGAYSVLWPSQDGHV